MPPVGHQPFLATILDRPAEDGPRLVYADWLEEQGDADRAELIRVQIELSCLAEDDPKRDRLIDRESSLLMRHGEKWQAEIPAWARIGCEFRRGFVECITIWNSWHRGYGEQISAACPVTQIVLQDVAAVVPEFAPDPKVRHLFDLAVLDTHMNFNSLMNLVNHHAIVAPLKSLRFMGTMFGDAGVNILALAGGLANLERLELKRCAIEARGIYRFTEQPNYLMNLRQLDLTDNNLESDSVWTLTHSEFVQRLTHLTLNNNEITGEGVQAIIESPYLYNLTHLELDDNHIGDHAALQLAKRFPQLQRLSLVRNSLLTAAGMRRLQAALGDRVALGPIAGF